MIYHCGKFYVNISTNVDTTNIFPFLAVLFFFFTDFYYFTPKIANFGPIQLGSIANIVS